MTATFAQVLRHRVTGRLAAGKLTAELADFVAMGALLVLTYEQAGSALGPSTLLAVRVLPALLAGTVLSGWLDMPPRRHAMVALATTAAVLLGAVAAFPTLAVTLTAAGLLGGIHASGAAVTAGAVAESVPEQLRSRLLGLLGAGSQALQVVGLIVGSTMMMVLEARWALTTAALLWAASASILATTPLKAGGRRSSGQERASPLDGFRQVWRHPVLRRLAPAVWVVMVASMVPETLASSLVTGTMVPVALAAGPAGGVLGAVVAARSRALARTSRQMVWNGAVAVVFAATAVALFAGAGAVAVVVGNLLIGFAGGWLVAAQVTFMRLAPPTSMGQISASMVTALIVLEGVGALLVGVIAVTAGPAAAYLCVGVLIGTVTLAATPALRAGEAASTQT